MQFLIKFNLWRIQLSMTIVITDIVENSLNTNFRLKQWVKPENSHKISNVFDLGILLNFMQAELISTGAALLRTASGVTVRRGKKRLERGYGDFVCNRPHIADFERRQSDSAYSGSWKMEWIMKRVVEVSINGKRLMNRIRRRIVHSRRRALTEVGSKDEQRKIQ